MSLQVIDASALLAVLYREADQDVFSKALASGSGVISAVNLHEVQVSVLRRLGSRQAGDILGLLSDIGATVAPFTADHAALALAAYTRFGKGFHPARLNICDCAAYALAQSRGLPLLYKGDDFARTDIVSALTPG